MSEVVHNPLPWVRCKATNRGKGYCSFVDSDGWHVLTIEADLDNAIENADFVNKACNNHYAMIHEMKELAKALEDTGHEPPDSFYEVIKFAEGNK